MEMLDSAILSYVLLYLSLPPYSWKDKNIWMSRESNQLECAMSKKHHKLLLYYILDKLSSGL